MAPLLGQESHLAGSPKKGMAGSRQMSNVAFGSWIQRTHVLQLCLIFNNLVWIIFDIWFFSSSFFICTGRLQLVERSESLLALIVYPHLLVSLEMEKWMHFPELQIAPSIYLDPNRGLSASRRLISNPALFFKSSILDHLLYNVGVLSVIGFLSQLPLLNILLWRSWSFPKCEGLYFSPSQPFLEGLLLSWSTTVCLFHGFSSCLYAAPFCTMRGSVIFAGFSH